MPVYWHWQCTDITATHCLHQTMDSKKQEKRNIITLWNLKGALFLFGGTVTVLGKKGGYYYYVEHQGGYYYSLGHYLSLRHYG